MTTRKRAGRLICRVNATNVGWRRQSGGANGGVTHKMDDVGATQQESVWGGIDLLPEVGGYADDIEYHNLDNVFDTKYSVGGARPGQLFCREPLPYSLGSNRAGSYGYNDYFEKA